MYSSDLSDFSRINEFETCRIFFLMISRMTGLLVKYKDT